MILKFARDHKHIADIQNGNKRYIVVKCGETIPEYVLVKSRSGHNFVIRNRPVVRIFIALELDPRWSGKSNTLGRVGAGSHRGEEQGVVPAGESDIIKRSGRRKLQIGLDTDCIQVILY